MDAMTPDERERWPAPGSVPVADAPDDDDDDDEDEDAEDVAPPADPETPVVEPPETAVPDAPSVRKPA